MQINQHSTHSHRTAPLTRTNPPTAVPIRYDYDEWMSRFESVWPKVSAAHLSYSSRMAHGPASFTMANAALEGVTVSPALDRLSLEH